MAYMDAHLFAKLSNDDVEQVKIAVIHPDFV